MNQTPHALHPGATIGIIGGGQLGRMLAMAAILAVSGPARVGRRQYSMLYIRHVRTKSVLSKPKTVSLPRDYVVAGCALPWEIAVRDGYFIL
jgi:hypothetical protein